MFRANVLDLRTQGYYLHTQPFSYVAFLGHFSDYGIHRITFHASWRGILRSYPCRDLESGTGELESNDSPLDWFAPKQGSNSEPC